MSLHCVGNIAVLKLNFVISGEFKFSGDFKICNTEDDGCTVETLLVVMFMHKIQLIVVE